jgi:hypothetical protein
MLKKLMGGKPIVHGYIRSDHGLEISLSRENQLVYVDPTPSNTTSATGAPPVYSTTFTCSKYGIYLQ